MSVCSPGSACIVSLRGIEPDPGPVAMTSTGMNHGCGPVELQGQSKARVNVGLMASSGSGLSTQGRVGPGLGSRLKARRHRQWAALGSARQRRLRAVAQAAVAPAMYGYDSGGTDEARLG